KRNPGTRASLAKRLISAKGWLSSLKLETNSVVERVALGFAHRDQNILARLIAIRILNRGIDLRKQSEVIELSLRLEHVLLAHGSDARLRSLSNINLNGQLRGIALILFQKFAGNLRLPEAVGPVHVLNGADVFLQQSLAVTPVTDHAPARLTEHRSAHQFCFE